MTERMVDAKKKIIRLRRYLRIRLLFISAECWDENYAESERPGIMNVVTMKFVIYCKVPASAC